MRGILLGAPAATICALHVSDTYAVAYPWSLCLLMSGLHANLVIHIKYCIMIFYVLCYHIVNYVISYYLGKYMGAHAVTKVDVQSSHSFAAHQAEREREGRIKGEEGRARG